MITATQVSGQDVWTALQGETRFTGTLEAGLISAYEEISIGLPTLLADLLDQTLTLSSMTEAKLRFLRESLNTHLSTKLIKILGSTNITGEEIDDMMGQIIGMFEDIANDVPAFLAKNGIEETQLMCSEKIGLSAKNQKLYMAGELTIGTLLLTQPSVIIKNS